MAVLPRRIQTDDLGTNTLGDYLLKLFVIFVVLRMFFFKPILSGLNNEEKSERVGQNLETTP